MSPEAQQIAIAKACGWRNITAGTNYRDPPDGERIFFNTLLDEDPVPDYCEDLNAMHEAECILTEERGQLKTYLYNLEMVLIVSGRINRTSGQEFRLVTATAAQRAEAFLRTLNLWTP